MPVSKSRPVGTEPVSAARSVAGANAGKRGLGRALVVLLLVATSCASETDPSHESEASPSAEPTVRALPVAPISSRVGQSAVWDGEEMLIWGGLDFPRFDEQQPAGAAYSPTTDEWRVLPDAPIARRTEHVSTYTGSEMLVWGGLNTDGRPAADGAAFNPATNEWRTLPRSPLQGCASFAAAWTGEEWLIVDAGAAADPERPTGQGAAYRPETDSWRELSPARIGPGWASVAVWTGESFVVVRLRDRGAGGGVQYDPGLDEWIPIPTNPDLTIQTLPFATWTGQAVLVARDAVQTSAGVTSGPAAWKYDPAAMTWGQLADPPGKLPYGPPVRAGDSVVFYAPGGRAGSAHSVTDDRWSMLPTIHDREREGWSAT
jgi:hypothetical protein